MRCSRMGLTRLTALILLASIAHAHGSNCQGCVERRPTTEVPELSEVQLPTGYEILRSIVPEGKVESGATVEQLLANGRIQKWVEPIRIYFAPRGPVQKEQLKRLIDNQAQPLLASISNATGLEFVLVESLREANAVIQFSEIPRLSVVGVEPIRQWMGASAEEFELVQEALQGDGKCFRIVYAPGDQISRFVGFVSAQMQDDEQENCMAKVLLYAVGLRGPAERLSAKVPAEDHRSIGILDRVGLELIYKKGVTAGMTLRDATAAPEN